MERPPRAAREFGDRERSVDGGTGVHCERGDEDEDVERRDSEGKERLLGRVEEGVGDQEGNDDERMHEEEIREESALVGERACRDGTERHQDGDPQGKGRPLIGWTRSKTRIRRTCEHKGEIK